MKDRTKSVNLLALSRSEETVFAVLTREAQSVAAITRKTALPRMTAFQALQSLRRRKLIERIPSGKRHFWARIETNQASNLLQMTFDALINPKSHNEKKLFIKTYEGAEELFSVLKDFFEAHAGERLVGFQSTDSAKDCVQAIGMERVIRINNLIKDNNIIIEAVLGKRFTKLGEEYGQEWKESYVGRAAAITIVPEEYLNLGVDIYVFHNSLLVIHWKERSMIEIIHPEIVNTFRKLIQSFARLGRKVDINALVSRNATEAERVEEEE